MATGVISAVALLAGAALAVGFGVRTLFLLVVAWVVAMAILAATGIATIGEAILLAVLAGVMSEIGFFASLIAQSFRQQPRPPRSTRRSERLEGQDGPNGLHRFVAAISERAPRDAG